MARTKEPNWLFRNWEYAAYLENGRIVVRKCREWSERRSPAEYPVLEALMKKHEYLSVQESTALSVLMDAQGMTMEELEAELTRTEGGRIRRRQRRWEGEARSKALSERFGNRIVNFDGIDFYDQGFTVSWLLNSTDGFEDQKAFVSENARDIAAYTREYLASRDTRLDCRKAAGLLPLCRLSNVVLTRSNRLDLKYDLKDTVVRTLKGSNGKN